MGEAIIAAIALVVFLAVLVTYAFVARRRRDAGFLDSWHSAPPPEGRSEASRARRQTPPEELFDPDRGYGGIGRPHHGDQRTFGGYGTDTAPETEDDLRSRRDDDRRRGAA